LLRRFVKNEYYGAYISTIGVDFDVKTINIDDKALKMQLWDTAGQDRFRSITTSYYRGAHAILIVCDVSSIDSFYNIPQWLTEVKRYASEDVQIMLVANKVDMVNARVVSTQDVKDMASTMGNTHT